MKKKILTFILALCFFIPCAFAFVGCGDDDKTKDEVQEFVGEEAEVKLSEAIATTTEAIENSDKLEVSGKISIDLDSGLVDFATGLIDMIAGTEMPIELDAENEPVAIIKDLCDGDDIAYNVVVDFDNGAYVKLLGSEKYSLEALYNFEESKLNLVLVNGDDTLYYYTEDSEEEEIIGVDVNIEEDMSFIDVTKFLLTLNGGNYTFDFDFDVDLIEAFAGLFELFGLTFDEESGFVALLSVSGSFNFDSSMVISSANISASINLEMPVEEVIEEESGEIVPTVQTLGEGEESDGIDIFELLAYLEEGFKALFDEEGKLNVINLNVEAQLKLGSAVTTEVPAQLTDEEVEWVNLDSLFGDDEQISVEI